MREVGGRSEKQTSAQKNEKGSTRNHGNSPMVKEGEWTHTPGARRLALGLAMQSLELALNEEGQNLEVDGTGSYWRRMSQEMGRSHNRKCAFRKYRHRSQKR